MSNADGTNYADFGPYTLESVRDASKDNIVWLDMPDDTMFWLSLQV